MPHGMFTDREKHGFGALFCQRLEYGWRIAGPRTVVEGEHYFPITQEIVGFEVLESEARSSSGVDFNDTCDAKSIRIAGHGPGFARCASVPNRSENVELLCAHAAAAMRGIEIAIAQTVAARILCSIPSKIAVSESNQVHYCLDWISSLLAMLNNLLRSI